MLRQQHQHYLATLHPAHASRLKLLSDISCRAVHLHAPPPCISSWIKYRMQALKEHNVKLISTGADGMQAQNAGLEVGSLNL